MAEKKKTNRKPSRIVKSRSPVWRWRHRMSQWHWWQRWPTYIAVFLILFALVSSVLDRAFQPVKDPSYGVSFSIEYANELGNNWQDNYTALLKDLKFKHLRLMSYWELIEPQAGHYDFNDLDWQLAQANKYGAHVSLAMGLRQPRWPECHEPDWAHGLGDESAAWKKQLYAYMEAVTNHVKGNPTIESYQLENEAANGWFGYCPGGVAPRQRLVEEFNLMKKLDPNHPTYMSLGDEHGLPFGQPVPDAYGFSIYRIVYSTNTPIHFYVTYPITIWYHRLRAAIISHWHHRPIFIHELQLEPWGPKPTKEMTVEQQDKSMSVSQMQKSFLYARKTGIKDEYMWGAEWWYWRMNTLHDPGPWNAVKAQVGEFK